MKFPAYAFKWQCGRCQHWNIVEHGTCSACGAIAVQYACCFQLHNKLTAEEENFYKLTAPAILQELRTIKQLLEDSEKET